MTTTRIGYGGRQYIVDSDTPPHILEAAITDAAAGGASFVALHTAHEGNVSFLISSGMPVTLSQVGPPEIEASDADEGDAARQSLTHQSVLDWDF